MDTQKCDMNIGSYGYTTKNLIFEWRSDMEPVVMDKNLQVSEFNTPDKFHTRDCGQGTTTGTYTCLESSFILKRQLGSYLASTYIPAVLIIMVSWLSFWVSVDAVPARVTLGLLTLLGILTQGTSLVGNLPRWDTKIISIFCNTWMHRNLCMYGVKAKILYYDKKRIKEFHYGSVAVS